MPWEIILTSLGTTGLTTILVVLLLTFAQNVIERSVEAKVEGFKSELRRAEAEFQSQLARAEARLDSELARAEAGYKSELARAEEQYKRALEVSSQIDIHLREQRIAVYKEIWLLTGRLPLWPRDLTLTYAGLLSMSEALRDWYFRTGGMWLSRAARTAYGAVQERITAILTADPSPTGRLDDEHYTEIQKLCSALRTELTNDLLSRSAPPERPPQPPSGTAPG
jgi:Sec-independent protein translocase protein TatA